ncbi:hypothetical protein BCR37DRAFT_276 [Protomyces lactucae-debilis]|uniref:Uncharacterized protein n=1 Tax=Protomyces lactucae-debilis TaxID=2754530 RepID=A0A1Y2FXZ1_PROLT|nr:uncharacterized protein BCR37DRAFT_276 [Protomyces lactucae-debilis]ORY87545.1 hypothetical protein BCR37DRAFT_276 [Protomyces lactucae-debilis]
MLGSLLIAAGAFSFADATPFRRLQARQQVENALICVPTTITRTATSLVPIITTIPECVGNACGINTVTQQGQGVVTSTLTGVNGQPGDVIGGTTFINPANTVQNAAFNSFTICDDQCTVAGVGFPQGQTVFFTSNQPVQPGTTTLGGTTVTNANVPVTIAVPQTNVFISTIVNGQTVTNPNQVVTIEVPIPGGVSTVTRTVTDIITPPAPPATTQAPPPPPGTTIVVTVTPTPPPPGPPGTTVLTTITSSIGNVPGTTVTETRTSTGPVTTQTTTQTVSSTPPILSTDLSPPPPNTSSSSESGTPPVTLSSTSTVVISPPVTSSSTVVTSPPVVSTTAVVTTATSSTSASASPSASILAGPACTNNLDCQGKGLPVAICLNATGVPVVGNIPISGGTCALSALLPTGIAGLNLTCTTNAQCTGIGLQTCVAAGLPLVGDALTSAGTCLLGVVSGTGTGPSNPQTTLLGLLSVGQQCTSSSQCTLGLCLPSLVNGLSACADPSLVPILAGGTLPSPLNNLPVVAPIATAVVGLASTILGPLVPTGSPLAPVLDPLVSGVLSALPLTDILGGVATALPQLPLVSEVLSLVNPTATNGLAAPVQSLLNGVGDIVGPVLGVPAPTTLVTQPAALPSLPVVGENGGVIPAVNSIVAPILDLLTQPTQAPAAPALPSLPAALPTLPTELPVALPTAALPTAALPSLPSALPSLPSALPSVPEILAPVVEAVTGAGSGAGTSPVAPVTSAIPGASTGGLGGILDPVVAAVEPVVGAVTGALTGGSTGSTAPTTGSPIAPVLNGLGL